MEENKFNNSKTSQKKAKNKNKEIVEMRLGKSNPAFNLISLKARYRLQQIKKGFSKSDYNAYIRRCKNMYSISSKLSSEMDISDIYHEEKRNINDIVSMYKKIDGKISSKRIRIAVIKNDNSKIKLLKQKSLSTMNFYKNISNLIGFKGQIKKNKIMKNKNKSQVYIINQDKSKIKTSNFNTRNNINSYSTNFRGDFSNLLINNKMSNTNKENDKITFIDKENAYINNANNKPFNLALKIKKNRNNDKTIFKIDNSVPTKKVTEFNGIYNAQSKQIPLSGKSTGLSITNFGAIIYNNSFFRNKKISNFLRNYQSLPLIYNSKY